MCGDTSFNNAGPNFRNAEVCIAEAAFKAAPSDAACDAMLLALPVDPDFAIGSFTFSPVIKSIKLVDCESEVEGYVGAETES